MTHNNNNSQLILNSEWIDDGTPTGKMRLSLMAAPHATYPASVRLAYTALTRIPPNTEMEGARYLSRTANYHELGPLQALSADADGLLWQITIPALSHRPGHFTDGPSSAFLILADKSTEDIFCTPFTARKSGSEAAVKVDVSVSSEPDLTIETQGPQLGLLPLANEARISEWFIEVPTALTLPEQLLPAGKTVNDLYERLFAEQPPFAADAKALPVKLFPAADLDKASVEGSYKLEFASSHIAIHAEGHGVQAALIALAQIWRAAQHNPSQFAFPARGMVSDWPAHDWRGMHLDVSRQFYEVNAVKAYLDCLAWHRFNRFHWHLSDDEGWRLESHAYPRLTDLGAWRGHGLVLLPQHGSGAARYGGFYSRQDVQGILAHAESLQIEVVPEIDVPGHCHAAMMAMPELLDPSAMQGGASVQGYVNNALNPGLGSTWLFLETVFGEVADLFPGRYVHIGGDEVAEAAWSASRSANSWARAKGYLNEEGKADTMKMQAAILRFVANHLVAAGKTPLAWEEAARGGGLDPEKAILFAWTKAQRANELASMGYRVIMCPGEICYLDMAQSDQWQEPGLSWAGTSNAEKTYHFEPISQLAENADKLLGIQGCVWSETLTSRERFNHMVFPRLSAIAETAWTEAPRKNWQGFAARQRLMPKLPLLRG
nr:family 20 glycosylhydrolase [uncultured Cohaesibacter sp.]